MSEDTKQDPISTSETAKSPTKDKKLKGRQSVRAVHESASSAPSEAATSALMGPSSSSSTSSGQKKKTKKKAGIVGDRPIFTRAVKEFLHKNVTFESSKAVEDAMADVIRCTKMNEVFVVPMRHKILNMDGCLRFMLFLHHVSEDPIEDEAGFSGDSKFSAEAAIKEVRTCFDEGIQDVVEDCIDDALDDGESGDESD
jgi:hypothetical protein